MGEQVDLPSWGQAEKVERDLEGLLKGSTWSVTHMQQEAQWGPSCPESRQGPTSNFFFLYLLAELNLGQFIFKKKNPVKLLRFGFQYFHISDIFGVFKTTLKHFGPV